MYQKTQNFDNKFVVNRTNKIKFCLSSPQFTAPTLKNSHHACISYQITFTLDDFDLYFLHPRNHAMLIL
ncbi:hypothetical protein B0181_10185 [Moraxella caviae]|uniref:Uncharacterized protein n=1 Tax=Moraxella caviae TaxID=34060 RepID=A0A1S9ZVR1_9GAMM|nr:hypothetical protein B0181_10185 [Moraxella caviae]